MEPLTPRAAADVVLEGLEAQKRRFSIVGRQGSGKSSTLDAIGAGLRDRDTYFVRVGLSHDQDAPFAALVDLASQLSRSSFELLDLVCNSRVSWRDKLAAVTNALVAAAPVVLFDEPRSPGTSLGRGVFASCAHELSHAILSADRLQVVAGEQTHGTFVPSHTVVSVRPTSLPRQVLERDWSSRELAAAAAELLKQDVEGLERYSPLELRLALPHVFVLARDEKPPPRRKPEKSNGLRAPLLQMRDMHWHEEIVGFGRLLARPDVPPGRVALGRVSQPVDGQESIQNIARDPDF